MSSQANKGVRLSESRETVSWQFYIDLTQFPNIMTCSSRNITVSFIDTDYEYFRVNILKEMPTIQCILITPFDAVSPIFGPLGNPTRETQRGSASPYVNDVVTDGKNISFIIGFSRGVHGLGIDIPTGLFVELIGRMSTSVNSINKPLVNG